MTHLAGASPADAWATAGPDDGDFTNCPIHEGYQTYRSCQSCRSAHPWASYCQQKTNLNFCWKPRP